MIWQPDREGTITQRFVLIESNALFLEPLRLAKDSTGSKWTRVANHIDLQSIERKLFAAGWTFFYSAGTVRTTDSGTSGQE